jgi:hypothetical protein
MIGVIYQQLLNKITKSTLGSGATRSLIAGNGKITLKKYHKYRKRQKNLNKAFRKSNRHLESLHQSCVDHMRPVTSPLALVSQIQRSGGSLLSQLFDGHPELHAHPHELKIGFPRKFTWPIIDLHDSPEQWFATLFEPSVLDHFKTGYKKQKNLDETFPFLFLPSVQSRLFLTYLKSIDTVTLRDVFDAYMTSYFGAWLNNQNSFGPKKYVTAFTARLSMEKENMEAFFKIYPEGRLISVIRDPKNWYPSAARHRPSVYEDIRQALGLWEKSARAMLLNKEKYGDRVCILTFEDLIGKTESVMRYLANFLDIKFDDGLLMPTFNKFPIKANTSFEARQHGIISGTLNRYQTLSKEELDLIDHISKDLHDRVCSRAVRF